MLKKLFYMKSISKFMAIVYVLFVVLSMPVRAQASQFNLINGTVVPVELLNTVSTKTAQVGQSIQFRVLKDIVLANKLLIEAGTIALGEVTEVKEPGAIGKPGSVGINVNRVTTVDGTLVTLEGRKYMEGDKHEGASIALTIICCILFLLMHGQPASLAAGTTIDATVVANYEIKGRSLGKNYVPTILEPIKIECTTKKCKKEKAKASETTDTSKDEGEKTTKSKNKFNR